MAELKACPFCGGKARLYKSVLFSAHAMVKCTQCHAQTAEYSQMDMENAIWFATNAWNRRKDSYVFYDNNSSI